MRLVTLKQFDLLRIKKSTLLELILIALISFGFFPPLDKDADKSVSDNLNNHVSLNISKIVALLDSIHIEGKADKLDTVKARDLYKGSRKYFKEIELYTEYHFPFYSKYFINGPLVNKSEVEYGSKTFTPHGFQVIESILFDSDTAYNFQFELRLLKQSLIYIKKNSAVKKSSEARFIDMMRFEIIRITSLYLNGYDSPINLENAKECEYILNGMSQLIAENFPKDKNLQSKYIIDKSISYLQKNAKYESLDRLYLITNFLKPLYEEFFTLYNKDAISEKLHFAVNIRQKEFYGENWINKEYFSVVLRDSILQAKQAELGKILFFDPILSGNNQRACASCHNPDNAFGGSEDFNLNFAKTEKLKRNSPTLVNAFIQKSFFYDGRSLQLEDQANNVLENHQEMFSDPENIVFKLKQSPEYKKYFSEAFKNSEDSAITYYAILKSLSEFERSLVSLDSRFDKYIRGDKKQLSAIEIKGYNLFAGKALCGSCHFFPLFNGLVPPFYNDNEFEVIGVPKSKNSKEIDQDSGRYVITKNHIHLHSFKTPGIRNSDKTAPFMHNSVFKTIDEVLDFYNKGGGKGLGVTIPNQTLPFDSLQLSKQELSNLKSFITTLTEKPSNTKAPASLPAVNIKGLEKRKVGGIY